MKDSQFEAKGLPLAAGRSGRNKLLTTSDGTEYRFAHFGNGEFHCSRIKDPSGAVIKLKYTNDASIETIADEAGRMISSVTKHYVNSITQTWGPASIKKTNLGRRRVVTRSRAVHPAVHVVLAGQKWPSAFPQMLLVDLHAGNGRF